MKYSICVSGAAAGKSVEQSSHLAAKVGKTIAESGHILTTGATVGLPFFAAKAATEAGGMSIGFSPASSLREHAFKYRLPIGVFDYINYTGLDYVGRDVYLVQSSDAVITVGGRFGSLHEFTTALEDGKICGVLLGSGGAADVIPEIMEKLKAPNKNLVIFDDDPVTLVKRILEMLDKQFGDIDASELANQWFLNGHSQKRSG